MFEGRYAEALEEYDKWGKAGGGDYDRNQGERGYALARAGRREEALRIKAEMQKRARTNPDYLWQVAIVCEGLGEKDEALSALESGMTSWTNWQLWIDDDPLMDDIRGDKRYAAILAQYHDKLRRSGNHADKAEAGSVK
jgi:tetratricopeptide (TPR) repeat protein